MTSPTEPEMQFVRRIAPWGAPTAAVAFLFGWALGGIGAGWSAGIGVAVVTLNLIAHGLSMAWAGRTSLTAIYAVGLGGFVVRLGVIVAIMFALKQFAFFSPVAFGLAVVPATIALLVWELKLTASGVGRELVLPTESATR
ncbi:MAG: hypothetical protein LC722_08230 [Actinobacteria bacterium]|nr:hypothetical protein [Actinomycetota bacterium]